jgi:hypothetical protein
VLVDAKDELAAVNWLLAAQDRLVHRQLPAILLVRAGSAAHRRVQEARKQDLQARAGSV